MTSGPITSWQIDGEMVESVPDFILGAPKSLQMVTAAMKLKDSLERKVMTNLDSILKSRHITLPTKVRLMSPIVYIRRQWNSIFIVLRESIVELGFLCPNYF